MRYFSVDKDEFKSLIKEALNQGLGLKIYTEKQVAELLKTNTRTIGYLRKYGYLKGIKTGRSWIYSAFSLNMFFLNYDGLDLSNEDRAKLERSKKWI